MHGAREAILSSHIHGLVSRDNELIQPLSGFNAISTLAKLVNADVYLCLGEAKLLPVSVKCNRLFIIPLSIR
jgi:hypothetical protein